MSIGTILNGLFTTARIVDAGLTTYNVTDFIWSEIDEGSRYPGLRDLLHKMNEEGIRYDTLLNESIIRSLHMTNLSLGLNGLNNTIESLDDKGKDIYKRYEALEQQRAALQLKFPVLRTWLDTNWIRKQHPSAEIQTAMFNSDNTRVWGSEMTYAFMGISAAGALYKNVTLLREGMSAYRNYRNPQVGRPRSNAIVAPTGRIERLGLKWTLFKARHPRFIKGLEVASTLTSLGLNIFVIVQKVKIVEDKKQEVRNKTNELKHHQKILNLIKNGTSTEKEISEIMKFYKFKTITDDQRSELQSGTVSKLNEYNTNLEDSISFVNETYEQLVDDAEVFSEQEQQEVNAIIRNKEEFDSLIQQLRSIDSQINANNDEKQQGPIIEQKRVLIDKIKQHIRDHLLSLFEQWRQALDQIIEIEKINTLLANKASRLSKTLIGHEPDSEFWIKTVRDAAIEIKEDSLDVLFPERSIYTSVEEIIDELNSMIMELNKTEAAA